MSIYKCECVCVREREGESMQSMHVCVRVYARFACTWGCARAGRGSGSEPALKDGDRVVITTRV